MEYEQSIKVVPSQVNEFTATGTASGPTKKNCLAQISHKHRLEDTEKHYDQHCFDREMRMLRNADGLGVPLKFSMDLYAVRQPGRFGFLRSSNLHEQVLLGTDEMMTFADFFAPAEAEYNYSPHVVMERKLGIL